VLAALLFCPPCERALGGLFAADGVTIAHYPGDLRREVLKRKGAYLHYSHIPRCLEQALISVEDKRFFRHAGVDPLALIRVLFGAVKNEHGDQGGSTITQQLARIILDLPHRPLPLMAELTSQLRITRAAFIIEHDFGKRTILELYLNSVYFGRGATGAAAAARAYFGASPEQLDEGECIYLAGLLQAPTRFGSNPSGRRSTVRYRHVIATMERNGYLTESEGTALYRENLFSAR
jgi:membrane peptidoglycan carboxypeptidase